MRVLAQNGVKNLAMEIPQVFQPLADKVAHGEISSEQYAQAKADMYAAAGDGPGSVPSARSRVEAQVIQNATNNGIKVLCVENQFFDLKTHGEMVDKLAAADGDYINIAEYNIGFSDVVTAVKDLARGKLSSWAGGTLFPNIQQRMAVEIQEKFQQNIASSFPDRVAAQKLKDVVEEKLSNDAGLAQSITALANGEKTVVFCGDRHGLIDCSLGTKLDATKIAFFPTIEALKYNSQLRYMDNQRIPDVSITLNDGKSFSRVDVDKILIKDAPRASASLTPTACKP